MLLQPLIEPMVAHGFDSISTRKVGPSTHKGFSRFSMESIIRKHCPASGDTLSFEELTTRRQTNIFPLGVFSKRKFASFNRGSGITERIFFGSNFLLRSKSQLPSLSSGHGFILSVCSSLKRRSGRDTENGGHIRLAARSRVVGFNRPIGTGGGSIITRLSISLFAGFRISDWNRSNKCCSHVSREGGEGISVQSISHDIVPGEGSSHAIKGAETNKGPILNRGGFIRWNNPGVNPWPHVVVANESRKVKRSSKIELRDDGVVIRNCPELPEVSKLCSRLIKNVSQGEIIRESMIATEKDKEISIKIKIGS